jgi:hypothetical protein
MTEKQADEKHIAGSSECPCSPCDRCLTPEEERQAEQDKRTTAQQDKRTRAQAYEKSASENVQGPLLGQCGRFTNLLVAAFPELRRIDGRYICPILGSKPHAWTVTPEARIVDVTAGQFPRAMAEGEYRAGAFTKTEICSIFQVPESMVPDLPESEI